MSEQNTQQVAVASQDWEGPQTKEEARCFHQGFSAGVTKYAGAIGHSTLRSANETLRKLMDEDGWKTIETYERLAEKGREATVKLMGTAVAQEWQSFALAVMPVDAHPVQRQEMRRSFYGGVKAMLEVLKGIGSKSVSEEDGIALMERIDAELNQFYKDMLAGKV